VAEEERAVIPEDVFFAVAMTRLGLKVAPRRVAQSFASECTAPVDPVNDRLLGLHKPYAYQSPDVVRVLVAKSKLAE
jgi:hypothetical protein